MQLDDAVFPLTWHSILYRGENQRGTTVFTWVASTNETSFAAEVSPLLQTLWRNGLLSPASHIGVVEFGSEAYHSPENVTFAAENFDMDLLIGPAPTLDIDPLPTDCSAQESSAARQGLLLSQLSIIGILMLAAVPCIFF